MYDPFSCELHSSIYHIKFSVGFFFPLKLTVVFVCPTLFPVCTFLLFEEWYFPRVSFDLFNGSIYDCKLVKYFTFWCIVRESKKSDYLVINLKENSINSDLVVKPYLLILLVKIRKFK